MLRIKIGIITVITGCLLSGCGQGAAENNAGVPFVRAEAAPVSMTSYTRSDYKVFLEEEGSKPSRYEPDYGCYLGAYVLANRHIGFDMEKFDSLAGKDHALSVYNMRLGEKFPYEWVLECASNMKTPYLIVKPPNGYAIFQEDLLIPAAKEFAGISTPVFVDFYPNPQGYTRDPERYIEFYRKASEVFSEHAPNVAMVVSDDSKSVYDFSLYYPGDEYVDWVGIAIYQPLYVDGEVNLRNNIKDLDYFYSMFQRAKPLVISQLAISSYSTADHRYASQESSKKLKEFYDKLKSDYTRIKAVNYMDFNNIDGAPKNAQRDNFSVTQDETMLNAYREAVADGYFLSQTREEDDKTKIEKYRSYYPVYEDENFKYISKSVFELELQRLPEAESVVINGQPHYSSEKLLKMKWASIDSERKQIVIKKQP